MVSLPPKIFTIYQFFDKTKDNNWSENPFKFYKTIQNINVKIAKNISNLNFYQVDFIIDKKINPTFMIKYIRNIQYRNYFSTSAISFKEISKINENNWMEEENYNGAKTIFSCTASTYQLLFYTNADYTNSNISEAKYYNSYKILNDKSSYILRFETVYNFLDIDQNIDLSIYIQMLSNIIRAVYKQLHIKCYINDSVEDIELSKDSDSEKEKPKDSPINLESFLDSNKK